MHSRWNTRVLLAGLAGLGLAVLMFGFVLFAIAATRMDRIAGEHADGIVVLTGETSRIAAGVRLLSEGKAGRMLISGVNRRIGRDDLRRLTRLGQLDFDCCVDIGYDARDTTGNADEARAWAVGRHYSSLIVVTASYHMPRSLTELGRLLPGTRLIPHAIVPKRLKAERWWLHFGSTRLLLEEYLKFLPSAARYASLRLIWPTEVGAIVSASSASRV